MVSIFNKYLPLYYNEAIRKNLTIPQHPWEAVNENMKGERT